MRIVHVITRLGGGGTERNLAHFADWQRARGHEVLVVTGPDPDTSVLPVGVALAVVPDLVREVALGQDLRARRQLRDLLLETGCEVLHTHQSKAGILGRLASPAGERLVVHTVHMPSFGPSYGRRSPAFRAAEILCARRTDLLVTVGEELRDLYLAAGIGSPSQYRVLHSPIDIDTFAAVRGASPDQRQTARTRLGLDPDLPTVIAVGALEARKRHDLAIDELQPLLRNRQLQLVIAGDGPERAALEQRAAARGVAERTHLVGRLQDVDTAFRAADVLVHTSTTEGVPQVVLQSLAAGVPVVTTAVPGIAELGSAAVTELDGAAHGLARRVLDLLADPPAPCDLATLQPWRREAVEEGIDRLHADIDAILRARATADRTGSRRRGREEIVRQGGPALRG
jgi:glycosyltransferase involved in cell wall biosynthesis